MKGYGHTPIDDWEKERFLEMYADGLTPPEAAKELDRTGTQFRRLRNPRSPSYDADFAEAFEELAETHRAAKLERLESAMFERALSSSDRLAEKERVSLDPRWEKLFKPQNFHAHLSVEQLSVLLPGVSNETLERMIAEAEAAKGQLKALPPIIDAA